MLHAKALHGNFFDSHTLPNWTGLTEIELRRIHIDKDYRSHRHAQKFSRPDQRQVRRVIAAT